MSTVSMTYPEFRRRECLVDGRLVHLSGHEAEMLLALLLTPPDRVLEKETLVEVLWPDPDTQPLTAINILTVLKYKLRSKGVKIDTAYGRGFTILEEHRGGRPDRRRRHWFDGGHMRWAA